MKPPVTHFNNPHHAARAALGRYGWAAPTQAIIDIVNAVFSAADGIADTRMDITPEAWIRGIGLRDHVRYDMRRELADDLAKAGHVPLDLPREHRTIRSWTPASLEDDAAWEAAEEPFTDDADDEQITRHLERLTATVGPSYVLRLRLWVPFRVPGRWTE